jgi:hypothetical protein
MIRDHADG